MAPEQRVSEESHDKTFTTHSSSNDSFPAEVLALSSMSAKIAFVLDFAAIIPRLLMKIQHHYQRAMSFYGNYRAMGLI